MSKPYEFAAETQFPVAPLLPATESPEYRRLPSNTTHGEV